MELASLGRECEKDAKLKTELEGEGTHVSA